MIEIIEVEQLRELFHIDAASGRLFWKRPPHNHPRLLGMEAGAPRHSHSKTYWVVKIGKRAYRRGRLIYLAVNGTWPEPCLDHIDGNSLNDGITNLRAATVTENAWNHKRRARRIDLPMGVRHCASGRFGARISHHGRQIHLGSFDTPEAAQAAYLSKRKELYREFA